MGQRGKRRPGGGVGFRRKPLTASVARIERREIRATFAEPLELFSRPITRGHACGFVVGCIMRLLSSLTLTTLAIVGLTAAPPASNGDAIAATAHAKPAHHAAPTKRRVAHSARRPIRATTEQVIAALLSQPPSILPQPLYVNGQRVCVDWAHPYYQWSDRSTSPAPPERPPAGWR